MAPSARASRTRSAIYDGKEVKRRTFSAPSDMEEAEERRLDTTQKLLELQSLLGSRNMTVDGRRLKDDEYWQWRDQKTKELHDLQYEARRLKLWIKRASDTGERRPSKGLVVAVCRVLTRVVEEYKVELEEDEEYVLKQARQRVGDEIEEEELP